ncbi:T9SS type B sorting domain-containing protein [Flavobacterium pallidum]|uniref:CARDB domain-containing protein n=1 Tax=Flavobacterium pallidum TaxID=2172098 RepID=A0A2S1SKT3_9FLAO|nr:gliding motility-associated C-terminal domain-containing protein [Flavobacterium pallidum]AWI27024.1 hypothetical protein HYN49_14540 [Flavobacterium pallidum]
MASTCCGVYSQDISLYQQFNGRYDFVFFGNTLNSEENNTLDGQPAPPCTILTESSATLALAPDDIIQSAYLYWAGSGTGDFDVALNGQPVTAQRMFNIINSAGLPCFGGFADITPQIIATGNADYLFTGLDLTSVIGPYCERGGNFGGWAIIVVYENAGLPLNQLNVYDGMQKIPPEIEITLNSLNVIDNDNAKIGFLAWEGDKNIDDGESLFINGQLLSNGLNPATNAFNGTNSFTISDTLYNMDLDVYDIQGNIHVGDIEAKIKLESGRDFVMINAIVTKLNSQLPDAVIVIGNTEKSCNSRLITVDYTVSNPQSTDPLPAHTQIAVFADDVYIGGAFTVAELPIGGSEDGTVTLEIPAGVPLDFTLRFVVDSDAAGVGSVKEINETNNTASLDFSLIVSPGFNQPQNLVACNEGGSRGTFDFSGYADAIRINPGDVVAFFNTENDASADVNPITITEGVVTVAPRRIFVRITNEHCFSVTSFDLLTRNCPPKVYNLVEPFPDNFYDTFLIDGLRDIFLNFKLSIFNRWGTLVWTGNNSKQDWDGTSSEGFRMFGKDLPAGTYFYILELNDPDYPQPLTGFVYLKK